MATLRLTPELEKLLSPRRARPGAHALELPEKILARLRKVYPEKRQGYWERTNAELFERGLDTPVSPELDGHRRAAHALFSDLSAERVRGASLETLAILERMVLHVAHPKAPTLVGVVAACRGLPDAVRVAALGAALDTGATGGFTNAVFVRPAPRGERFVRSRLPELRALVCRAPEADYQAAREVAARLREEAPLALRALVAGAFPDEPWAGHDLEAWLASGASTWSEIEWLPSATERSDVVRAVVARTGPSLVASHALDLAASLPEGDAFELLSAALPALLVKPKYGPLLKTPPRDVARALACLEHPGVPGLLASYLTSPVVGAQLVEHFRARPEQAGALEAAAKASPGQRTKGAKKLEAVALRVRRAEQLGAEQAEQGSAEGASEHAPEQAREAAPHELPRPLRDTPWRSRTGRARRHRVLGLALPVPFEERFVEPASCPPFESDAPPRPMTPAELREWQAERERGGYVHVDFEHQLVGARGGRSRYEWALVPDELGLEAWNARDVFLSGDPRAWAAKHGLAALPGFVRRDWASSELDYEGGRELVLALACYESPRVAPCFARMARGRKALRPTALAWLAAHAELAAVGLVPVALGDDDEAARDAEEALRALAFGLVPRGRELVLEVAARYGEPARVGISALLERDALAEGGPAPKLPPTLRLAELPAVHLREGGARLGLEAVRALVELFSLTPPWPAHGALALVRDACTPASLSAFVAELVEQWALADAPGKHDFMVHAAAHVPSDAQTRRLGELARELGQRDGAKAARVAVALAAIGSDLALVHLARLADKARKASLRAEAAALVAAVARARGLSDDELADRMVPEAMPRAEGGAAGTLELCEGGTTFVVSLDEALRPVVRARDGEGLGPPLKNLTSLPGARGSRGRATRAGGEGEAGPATVREVVTALRADLEVVSAATLARLERALATGRVWSVDVFREHVALHPVVTHLARRLVWELSPSRGLGPWREVRVAEDGTLADADDEPVRYPAEGLVRLAHLARGLRPAWRERFADYLLVQPFEQLGRACYEPTAREREATTLERATGRLVAGRRLLGGLEARGFVREGGSFVATWRRALAGRAGERLVARLAVTPGVSLDDVAGSPEQTLGPVRVTREATAEAAPLGALDAVAFSELVRDVLAVSERA